MNEENATQETQTRVSDKDFVLAYRKCFDAKNNIVDLGICLNLRPTSVAARAVKLRKLGVNLPVFPRRSNPRGKKVVDVEGLNSLLQ